MLEYRVVVATGKAETYQERPVQLVADTLESAEQGALSLFKNVYPDARVAIAGLVNRAPEDAATAYPYVGGIVRLKANSGKAVAAIITDVHKDAGVSLTAFVPDHLPGYVSGVIPFSKTPKVGHWSWPWKGQES